MATGSVDLSSKIAGVGKMPVEMKSDRNVAFACTGRLVEIKL